MADRWASLAARAPVTIVFGVLGLSAGTWAVRPALERGLPALLAWASVGLAAAGYTVFADLAWPARLARLSAGWPPQVSRWRVSVTRSVTNSAEPAPPG